MTLLAGLAVGVFVYFLVGFLTGYAPEIKVRRFRRRAQISNRQLWLNQAGVALTSRQFAAGSIAVGSVAFGLLTALTGTPLVAIVPAAGVAALPRKYFARRRTAHLQRVHCVARRPARRHFIDRSGTLVASSPERTRRFGRPSRGFRCCPACSALPPPSK